VFEALTALNLLLPDHPAAESGGVP
jgi:hypothetical protein